MDLDDPRWSNLRGGYWILYDPRKAIKAIESEADTISAWQELWDELYHQGDVGEASYASVPHLVRIHAVQRKHEFNTYALAATIELARYDLRNPTLPVDMENDYRAAWRQLTEIGLQELAGSDDPEVVSSIIAVLSLAKGQRRLGEFALCFTEAELAAMLPD